MKEEETPFDPATGRRWLARYKTTKSRRVAASKRLGRSCGSPQLDLRVEAAEVDALGEIELADDGGVFISSGPLLSCSRGAIPMTEEKKDEDLTICGGDDFLADQGIADPDEFRVKSHLSHEIATIAEQRGLTLADVARLAGEPEEDLDRIVNHQHGGYEVWRLIKVLTALGADVGITVFPDGGHDRGVVLPETVRKSREQILRELAEMDEIDYQPEPRL